MMTFVTPAPDTGERISLVLTSLVSMFFFLKLVSERTPATDTIPLLSVYFVMLSFEVRFCYMKFFMYFSTSLMMDSRFTDETLGR